MFQFWLFWGGRIQTNISVSVSKENYKKIKQQLIGKQNNKSKRKIGIKVNQECLCIRVNNQLKQSDAEKIDIVMDFFLIGFLFFINKTALAKISTQFRGNFEYGCLDDRRNGNYYYYSCKESILEQLIWKVVFYYIYLIKRVISKVTLAAGILLFACSFAQAFYSLDEFSTYTT